VRAADEPGEEEVGWVAATQRGVFAAAGENQLRALERLFVDQRLV
jgi:hypothetical protein